MSHGVSCDPSLPSAPASTRGEETAARHVALLGNPNTGKTTLFNRLCGLRHKTSNFAGTTQEARIGLVLAESPAASAVQTRLIDLPGVYSLELQTSESLVCRNVLAGTLAPRGETMADPDALIIVADATNLPRNLVLIGEALRRRLPTVVALNMIDLARGRGLAICPRTLGEHLGCRVVLVSARTGEGLADLQSALAEAHVPVRTPPGAQGELEIWAERVYALAVRPASTGGTTPAATDRIDAVLLSRWLGLPIFALIMAGLFYLIFALAAYPMDWIDHFFTTVAEAVRAATGALDAWAAHLFGRTPELHGGLLEALVADGVVTGIGATAIFIPQIFLLVFCISLLEDTGYLARAALLVDRMLRPFGLPGHAFVPLLSAHACALPGITACRVIPDRRERLAAILVAPFMTCSARLPVYVLVATLLFADRPALAGVAFVGCYALGAAAGLLSAALFRCTLLRGAARPMAIELPDYKRPSLRTALLTAWDRAFMFLKNAGTVILGISVALWWLSAFPHAPAPAEAVALRMQAADLRASDLVASEELAARADVIENRHHAGQAFSARLGRLVQPLFAPLGYDEQLSVGVLTSFAARETFVSTMAVITTGQSDAEDQGVLAGVQAATRADGRPIFTTAVSWSVLVYFVLAMQCLPTLAVTAREAGGWKWAGLQFLWMSAVAYVAALVVYQALRAWGYA